MKRAEHPPFTAKKKLSSVFHVFAQPCDMFTTPQPDMKGDIIMSSMFRAVC
jgi:hypothetical protein